MLGQPGGGLGVEMPAAGGGQRAGGGAQGGSGCISVLRCGSVGETGVIRHRWGLDRDHGGLNGNGAQTEAPRGAPQVGLGGRCPTNGGDPWGDYGRGVGGQAGGGGRTFGLKHAAVQLADVDPPGDGGRLIAV